MRNKTMQLLTAIFILLQTNLLAQVSLSDYQRADSTENWSKLVYHGAISPKWDEKGTHFWYEVHTPKGQEYMLVDAKSLKKAEAFDQVKLAQSLNSLTHKSYKAFALPIKELKFDASFKSFNFVVDSFRYECKLSNYQIINKGKIEAQTNEYWNAFFDDTKNPPVVSPDSAWIAFIKNYNVYLKNRKTGEETALSFDGSEGEFYSSFIEWAPDSKHLVTNKVRANTKKYIYFVESSPKTQLQPILQKRDYLKPGDALPIRMPSLFSVADKKQIPVDTKAYENQFEISDLHWFKDSRAFTFEFNERGHQNYKVVEVNAITGQTTELIKEHSNTFIDYSGKKFRSDVNDGKEIIWASERDGWNHLYLYDGSTGQVKNQITNGEWVVREVVNVDEKSRTILFKGSGENPGEDPYLIHYYIVNFDGTNLTDLTPEGANHDASFSPDYKFFVDCYSRADQPQQSVLRDGKTGKALLSLEKADISALLKTGYRLPEVFTATARDGKTEIWGNIYRPSNFDPNKKYPIIEYIYAGPQGAFVSKTFRPYYYPFSGLAELGFIIVSIDGMGTSYRSKAFQNVCYKNLKDAGFPDRIKWTKAAAEKYPYMDTTRVGIFGGSAGGQNAMAAVLFHPEFYKASVASCGCHDNRMDKMWWNEQWMGYPIGPQYAECSNVDNAWRLKGNLMLIVGEMDDNVDPASTMQVANALINAKKDFELVVLPEMNHTLGGTYGERKRRDFFVQHLLNCNPPAWNASIK